MTCTFRVLSALLGLLVVAQAAPSYGDKHRPHAQWAKRQPADFVITETRTEVFSGTLVETITETFTASIVSSTDSQLESASTTLPAPVVSSGSSVDNDPNSNKQGQGVMFMPIDSDSPGGSSSSDPTPTGAGNPSSVPSQANDSNSNTTASPFSGGAGPSFAANTSAVSGPLLSAYYPAWAESVLPPENIDMSRLDWIDFAFGVLNQDFSIAFDDTNSSSQILTRLVAAAHAAETKVKLSIGGWDGSRYFSSACSNEESRATLVNNIVNVYKSNGLDGIDIDWEYPGQQGASNNTVSPQDSANFLAMLRLLRSSLPGEAVITAAGQDVPFAGPDGNPMSDVSSFADVLDFVNIMNYDVFSSSSNPGPNAPLDNGCQDSSQPQFNARAAINAWTNAQFPASKLMLGVPFYGYLNPSDATQLQHKKRSLIRRQDGGEAQTSTTSSTPSATDTPLESVLPLSSVPIASSLPDVPDVPAIAVNITTSVLNDTSPASKVGGPSLPNSPQGTLPPFQTLRSGDGTTDSGQIQFSSIVNQSALLAVRIVNGTRVADTTSFVATGGFTRYWDSCSSTPFLTSPYSDQMVTYDDTDSLGLKAQLARESQILGVAVWDLSGDTPQWDLINALRRGLGKPV